MLLRIEIGGGGSQQHQGQARMGGDQIADGNPTMPWCPILQHHQRPIRISAQDLFTILGGGGGIQPECVHDKLPARGEIERPIQARFGPSWITADRERLPAWNHAAIVVA